MTTKPLNEWSCPGCSTLVVYKGYGRRGKYCTRDCLLAHQSQLRKAETAAKRAARPSRSRSYPKQGNLICRQCGGPMPKYGKIYCSRECNGRSKYEPKHKDRVSPPDEARKTQRNIKEALPCSLCGKTTARKGWYKVIPHPMIPPGVELCSSHRRSFAGFVMQNGYGDMDVDQVWTMYLIKITFANAGGQPWLVMMRKAVKSKTADTSG